MSPDQRRRHVNSYLAEAVAVEALERKRKGDRDQKEKIRGVEWRIAVGKPYGLKAGCFLGRLRVCQAWDNQTITTLIPEGAEVRGSYTWGMILKVEGSSWAHLFEDEFGWQQLAGFRPIVVSFDGHGDRYLMSFIDGKR
ncbi:hypothetical protein ACFLZP_03815 [Patescibacteria group bacterium]